MWPCGTLGVVLSRASLAASVIAVVPRSVISQEPARPTISQCTGAGCWALNQGKRFIAIFAGAQTSAGLGSNLRGQEEHVLIAFLGIDVNRRNVEMGRLSVADAEGFNARYRKTIEDYIDTVGARANRIAAAGRASDKPAIDDFLSRLLSIVSTDSLVGHEVLGAKAARMMQTVLETFSRSFAATCTGQSFPQSFATGLLKRLTELGVGIDITDCLRREAVAVLESYGVIYHLRTCMLPGLSDKEDSWTLSLLGNIVGQGTATTDPGGLPGLPRVGGNYFVDGIFRGEGVLHGQPIHMQGRLVVFEELSKREERPLVSGPDDAGPFAKANQRPFAPVPNAEGPMNRTFTRVLMQTARIYSDGGRTGIAAPGDSAEAEVTTDVTPCKA